MPHFTDTAFIPCNLQLFYFSFSFFNAWLVSFHLRFAVCCRSRFVREVYSPQREQPNRLYSVAPVFSLKL